MDFQSIIAARRDGRSHTREEMAFLAQSAADGSVPDYQLSAWLMAAYLNPLDAQQTGLLTVAMADSGDRIDLTGLPKPWVDKHSTGGVGDKTSIVLLPLLASCGLTVVKMSGRGLGITGGTVDKLGSVPGFRMDLSPDELKDQAKRIGIAITGQTKNLAPADKALYALRDATATVDSIPLIVSSILSKKLAGGAETVVLDVKCGSGAFMHDLKSATELAKGLAETAEHCGLKVRIAITDMDQPLGAAVGNALEVAEAIQILDPDKEDGLHPNSRRFRELCIQLAAITLTAAGLAPNHEAAVEQATEALESGEAAEKAKEWFKAQGAADPFGGHSDLPKAAVQKLLTHEGSAGWVAKINAEAIGRAVILLGGGREKKEDVINPSVGIVSHLTVGQHIEPGQRLFTVHAAGPDTAAKVKQMLIAAVKVVPKECQPPALIHEIL